MTKTQELRDLIKEAGLKYNYLAGTLGLSAYGLQKKIENKSEFRASEIQILVRELKLTTAQMVEIFFETERE